MSRLEIFYFDKTFMHALNNESNSKKIIMLQKKNLVFDQIKHQK
jgi:hypothetical protein